MSEGMIPYHIPHSLTLSPRRENDLTTLLQLDRILRDTIEEEAG
jgi:hypothetical protein